MAPTLLAACRDDAAPRSSTKIAALADLEAGGPIAFTLPSDLDGFVVKLPVPAEGGIGPDESIVAFSILCPHMGCPIDVATGVDVERGRFGPCACHQSMFDLRRDGRMVYGCASSNLCRIELSIVGEDIHAVAPVRLPFGQPLTAVDALTTPEPDQEE